MVRELIKRQFNVSLSDVSVGRLLRKIGLSPQKPMKKSYQQDELLVFKWMAEDLRRLNHLPMKLVVKSSSVMN
jgi:transposase